MQQQNKMQMMDAPPPPPAITFGNLAERARRGLNFKVVGFMPSNAKFEDIHKDDILFDLIQTVRSDSRFNFFDLEKETTSLFSSVCIKHSQTFQIIGPDIVIGRAIGEARGVISHIMEVDAGFSIRVEISEFLEKDGMKGNISSNEYCILMLPTGTLSVRVPEMVEAFKPHAQRYGISVMKWRELYNPDGSSKLQANVDINITNCDLTTLNAKGFRNFKPRTDIEVTIQMSKDMMGKHGLCAFCYKPTATCQCNRSGTSSGKMAARSSFDSRKAKRMRREGM